MGIQFFLVLPMASLEGKMKKSIGNFSSARPAEPLDQMEKIESPFLVSGEQCAAIYTFQSPFPFQCPIPIPRAIVPSVLSLRQMFNSVMLVSS
jgi:hypothetical protein